MNVTVHNRGPDAATLHVLPQLWFRNTWSWAHDVARPQLELAAPGVVEARHATLGRLFLHTAPDAELVFADNDTNVARLYGQPRDGRFFKDAVDAYVVHGQRDAVN